jgi:hypothetical protein
MDHLPGRAGDYCVLLDSGLQKYCPLRSAATTTTSLRSTTIDNEWQWLPEVDLEESRRTVTRARTVAQTVSVRDVDQRHLTMMNPCPVQSLQGKGKPRGPGPSDDGRHHHQHGMCARPCLLPATTTGAGRGGAGHQHHRSLVAVPRRLLPCNQTRQGQPPTPPAPLPLPLSAMPPFARSLADHRRLAVAARHQGIIAIALARLPLPASPAQISRPTIRQSSPPRSYLLCPEKKHTGRIQGLCLRVVVSKQTSKAAHIVSSRLRGQPLPAHLITSKAFASPIQTAAAPNPACTAPGVIRLIITRLQLQML